jgi:hypothetical protein
MKDGGPVHGLTKHHEHIVDTCDIWFKENKNACKMYQIDIFAFWRHV